jgi:exonuclease SbcC
VLFLAERAYGRDGIPALILENAAIPQIETEANRILAELGTSFTVELRTLRELKSGGLAEALDIVVVGTTGERPYETFSGGERTRLNLALRIALARLLAHRRGAEVRALVVDEPEFLDEAGIARLVEVLRGLSADFERTYLISHAPALREAFDEVLTVTKVGDSSAIAGDRQEVPA